MISQTTMHLLGLSTILTILIPILLVLFWIIKTKSYIYPLFIGGLIYFIFVMLIENSLQSILFDLIPDLSISISLYVFYCCLSSGLFEVSGRWFAFKTLIKSKDKKNAITYGIGYGGIEMILGIGITLLSTFVFAQAYNTLGIDGMLEGLDSSMQPLVYEMIQSIQVYDIQDVFFHFVEKGSILLTHISCSIFVFYAVNTNHHKYLGYAFIFYILLNVPLTLLQKGMLTHLWLAEGIVFLVAMTSVYIGYKIYKNK